VLSLTRGSAPETPVTRRYREEIVYPTPKAQSPMSPSASRLALTRRDHSRDPHTSPDHLRVIPHGITFCLGEQENKSPYIHEEEACATSLGQSGQDGFDASTSAYVRRIGVADRPHDGAEGCLAQGAWVCHSHDSVLHQSWRPAPVREPPARARTGKARPAAATTIGGMSVHDAAFRGIRYG
jgi:hypothetical protein